MAKMCTMIAQWDRLLGGRASLGSSSRLARAAGESERVVRSNGYWEFLQKTGSGFLRYAYDHDKVDQFADLRARCAMDWVFSSKNPKTQDKRLEVLRWMVDLLRQDMGLHVHLVPTLVHRGQDASPATRETPTWNGQWTPQQAEAIIAYARAAGKDALATALQYGAAGLGLRTGEIGRVRVGDWDPATGILTVGYKWSHPRSVHVPENLQACLNALAAGRSPEERLFPGATAGALQEIVREARTALGLPPGSVTAFRHARAQAIFNQALASGLSEADARREVAKELGHGPKERPRIDVARLYYLWEDATW